MFEAGHITIIKKVQEEVGERDHIVAPRSSIELHLVQTGKHHVASEIIQLFLSLVPPIVVYVGCGDAKINKFYFSIFEHVISR